MLCWIKTSLGKDLFCSWTGNKIAYSRLLVSKTEFNSKPCNSSSSAKTWEAWVWSRRERDWTQTSLVYSLLHYYRFSFYWLDARGRQKNKTKKRFLTVDILLDKNKQIWEKNTNKILMKKITKGENGETKEILPNIPLLYL